MLTTEEPFSQALSLGALLFKNVSLFGTVLYLVRSLCFISCAVCVVSRAQSVLYLARSLCCISRTDLEDLKIDTRCP